MGDGGYRGCDCGVTGRPTREPLRERYQHAEVVPTHGDMLTT